MKKTVAILLALVMLLALCSCGASVDSITLSETETSLNVGDTTKLTYEILPADAEVKVNWTSSDKNIATVDENGVVTALADGTVTITAKAKKATASCTLTVKKEVLETENFKIEGMYVDNSYVDDDNENSSLKMLYVFYTVTATDENLSVDSVNTKLTVNDNNSYTSANYPGVCRYMSNYYYSSYLESVYVGDTLKVVETYEIPVKELEKGNTLTFSIDEKLLVPTDLVVFCDSVTDIAKKADNEGYKEEVNKRADADDATKKIVQNNINDYEWTFYVNYTTYKLSFSSPNKFNLSTSLGTSNSGTYSIKNGYIFCTYPDTKYTVEIPYEIVDGEIDLDVTTAFDVN